MAIILDSQLNLASSSLQDGATMWHYSQARTTHTPTRHPPAGHLFLSMLCGVPTPIVPLIKMVCAVSPLILCGVPTPIILIIKKVCPFPPPNVVRCPYPNCSLHQEGTCGVPLHSALSWILSKVENLVSSSLQDEATDYFFNLTPVELII